MRWRSFGVAVALVVAYAILVLSTHRGLFGPGDLTFGGDARSSYWQDLVFAVESLRDLQAPLWNPYERGGYPFSADPQAAIWAPLSWLCYLLGWLLGDHGHWLAELRQLAAPLLAAAGMHLFLRRRGLSHPAAALAGTILASGAFAQRTITMATYWPWAYLGLVLAATDAILQQPDWTRARWLALVLLLLCTSGFPPSIFYALLIAVPYALLRILVGGEGVRDRWRALWAMTGAAAVASLGGLVVIWPLLEQTALSWRASRGLHYILSNPAKLADLQTLLDPTVAGKQIFIGLLGLMMAALALTEIFKSNLGRRKEVLFWLLVTIAGVLLAAANETPLLALLATHLPGFDLFRIASRYMILTHTGLAVLAAYGLDLAFRSALQIGNKKAVGSVDSLGSSGRQLTIYAIYAIVCTCLFVQIMDLQRVDVQGRFARPYNPKLTETLSPLVGDARIYNEWSLGPRGGSVYGIRDWRGRSRDPMSFARYQEVERAVTRKPAILRHFAVTRLLLGGRRQVAARPRIRRPQAIPGIVRETPTRYRLPDPGPEVYWSSVVIETAPGEALALLSQKPVASVVIVDRGELSEAERRNLNLPHIAADTASATRANTLSERDRLKPSTKGRVIERQRNRLIVEINTPATGIVSFAEVWHPGWSATVDGTTTAVHRVNHLLRGVLVGPGKHRIVLVYRPRSLPWTGGLFLLAWIFCLVDVRRLWRRGHGTATPRRA
ncbi:MAG TPA: hypothetical protein ENJ18_07320 [Nannocystis exedens]|nr:hypothetical protein [Nannocystis exedens]